jgi:cytoskeletal protein RodZ
MTARHQIRVGGRLRGRSPIDATPAPSVGEVLLTARERKGVDLHRAERDTKIRAKHLAALESGDYTELPGSVYTRGFLRNYAAYLGLDADEVLEDWRLEQEATAPRVREPLALPPQPLVEPKGHLRFTRQVFVGVLLVFVVTGFLAYLGFQLLRFSNPPRLTLDHGVNVTLAPDATSYTLSGKVDLPAAVITVKGPAPFQQTTDADAAGHWSMQVPVTKGRNDFEIRARDPAIPDPDRGSAPLNVILTVPIPATPGPSSGPLGTPGPGGSVLPAAQIALVSPLQGAQLGAGAVNVTGTTNATGITLEGQYLGPPGVEAPAPPSPAPAPSTGSGGGLAGPIAAEVSNGTFSASLNLSEGRWRIVAYDAGLTAQAAVTVDVTTHEGVVVTVVTHGGAAWIRATVDGKTVQSGRIFRNKETETYTAKNSVIVQTGNAGTTVFIVNGRDLGTLGGLGIVQTWQFEKGKAPRKI